MTFAVVDSLAPDAKSGSLVMGETLLDLVRADPRVMIIDADLAAGSKLDLVHREAPDQFVSCGIHEQNMISVAAGMSEVGVIPFTHSFAAFAVRRCFDQIFLSVCFNDMNVKMIGTDPGIVGAHNGATHQCYEDMGALRGLPNITLLEATDVVMLDDLLRQMATRPGNFYLRTFRKQSTAIYKAGSQFEIGKGNVLRDGDDATIVASGLLVSEALDAATVLADKGISTRVVDMFTWKPLDTELVARCAVETGAIITAENHQTSNGLGAAVASAVARTTPVPMGFVGVENHFGEVGRMEFLRDKFGLTSSAIVEQVDATVKRKPS